jgi:DNA-binding GntR family transcriptional regulator
VSVVAPIPVHRTKVEMAYEFLRERILNGELAPGERVTLASLSQMLNTSQMPTREAMLKLQQEGLVEITPHTGMRIAPFEPKDVREIFQVRAALEGLAARLACARLDEAGIERLEAINARFGACQKRDDFAGMAEANWEFHRLILQYADNKQLTKQITGVWDKCFRFRAGYRLIPGRSGSTVDEHRAILVAFRSADAAAAAAAAIFHVETGGDDMMRHIEGLK